MRTLRALGLAAALLVLLITVACGSAGSSGEAAPDGPVSSLELRYATGFSVDFYEDGAALLAIHDTERYLLLPEGAVVPAGLEEVTALPLPLDHIYLAASSAMDFFRQLDTLDSVIFTSTTESDWSLPAVREALEAGTLRYAGRYSAPDYEALLAEGTKLAIESTMLTHSPEVRDQLERSGIPVLMERSSYEPHPLGRLEWIKLYGLLTGRLEEAQTFFEERMEQLAPILNGEPPEDGPTVSFFYFSSGRTANVRKPGDYVARLIEMAGGRYVFADLPGADDNDLSTINLQLESFYAQAVDADILIYNSTIDAELESLEDLLAKNDFLADFRAVQTGNAWCTGKNLYQQVTGLGDLLQDLHTVISGTEENELTFLHRLT